MSKRFKPVFLSAVAVGFIGVSAAYVVLPTEISASSAITPVSSSPKNTISHNNEPSPYAAVNSFDAKFTVAVAKHKIPGAVYTIIEGTDISRQGAVGTRAVGARLPVSKNTVFRIASVSKTFSAELAALLISEGKFSWDDTVIDAVPSFKLQSKGHAARVKVKHLLSHSVGLTPNSYDNMLEDGWTLDKIIPRFGTLKPICKPGTCYGYQNIAFSFIQPIIEKSTGASFESLMQDRLFNPLEMGDSSMGLEGFLSEADRAEPHVYSRKGWHRVTVKPHYYNVAPAAGVNASAEDMAKWVRAQMGYNKDILPEILLETVTAKRVKTRREMRKRNWRPHLKEAHYGYGWRIYKIGGEEIIMHAGGVSGFRSLIGYSKKRRVGLVIMMNAETRSINQLGSEFWASLVAEPVASGARTVTAGR
ncbi:MAG: beta-lactamase family protein [Kordiimonadaceae bacterium]|nr:beta-lactamase family protein [Kordiimonadaceae bacterium]